MKNANFLNYNSFNDSLSINREKYSSSSNKFFTIEKNLSILPAFLMIFGTLGNSIAFYVLTRKKLRTQSTMLYFACLTVLDTVSLYQWNFNFFYKYHINALYENLENQSIFLCRYISFMANFSIQSSAWILAIITIDRYLIVTNATWKQKYSKNIKFNLTIILSVISFFALINLPVTLLNGKTVTIYSKNSSLVTFNRTRTECYNTKFYQFWQNVIVLIECILPLILMIIFNGLLIYRTYKSSVKLDNSKNRQKTNTTDTTNQSSNNEQTRPSSSFANISPPASPKTDNSFHNFVPLLDLNKSKSFQQFCSLSVIPAITNEEEENKENTTLNLKHNKSRRFSIHTTRQEKNDTLTNNYEFKRSNTYLTNKFLAASNYKMSNKNLTEATQFNLSRSCLSLADSRPVTIGNNRNRKIVQVLTLLTLSFTISTLPSSIFYSFLRPIFNDKPYKRLLTNSFNLLRHLSHAFNFIIYFTSSSIIKQQLKDIIKDLNNKKSIKYLKGRLSCFLINHNQKRSSYYSSNTNMNNNKFKSKDNTQSVTERKDHEETSVFLNNYTLANNEQKENISTDLNKLEIIKNEINLISEIESENHLNQDNDNPKIEFESISFRVPNISNSKKNKK